MKNLLSAGFLLFYFMTSAQTNWHVAVTGSDTTGDGSINAPYATLQKAADMVQAGDTIFVHQGDYYNEHFGDGDIWKNENLMTLSAQGTANNYIVIMPYPGDHVTLHSDSKYNIRLKNSSYIKIEGFEFEGVAADITQSMADAAWGLYKDDNGTVHDLAVELGIDINDPSIRGTTISKSVQNNIKKPSYYNGHGLSCYKSHHIIFANNVIHDFPASGLRADKSDYITITRNEIYNNTFWTSAGVGALTIAASEIRPSGDTNNGVKIFIEKNYVHHSENRLISWSPSKDFIHMVIDEGSGIFLTRNSETYTNGYFLIANNISVHNGASGIIIHKTDRVIAEYNTVYKNGTTNDGKPAGIGLNNVNTATIRNNISYVAPDDWALYKNGGVLTAVTVNNNIVYNENGNAEVVHNLPNAGYANANPLFSDASNNDFHLTSSSPAISYALPSTYTNDDYDENVRDAQPDAGAFEFMPNSVNTFTNKSFHFYPNPVSDKIYIEGLNSSKKYLISIYDVSGKIIFKQQLIPVSKKILLPLNFLKTGIYFIEIGHERKLFVKK